MAAITDGSYIRRYFVLKGALGLDLCSHYNQPTIITVNIISGVHCMNMLHDTVDSSYNIHGYMSQPVIVAT